jgi:hypothetical protein
VKTKNDKDFGWWRINMNPSAPVHNLQIKDNSMNPYEQWRKQCAAVPEIRRRFGVEAALNYLVGEKFVVHLSAMNSYPELEAETPKFIAEIKKLFQPCEIAAYFAKAQSAGCVNEGEHGHELDEDDRESIIYAAELKVLLDKAKELLE